MIKNIDGFPGYAITEDAKVYHNGKEIKPSVQPNGYVKVYLYKDDKRFVRYLHRLVAEAFIPNPDHLPEVNHKDRDKSKCESSNLEWTSRQGNMIHGKGRAVNQILNGKVIRTFQTISQAADAVGDKSHGANIHRCLTGKRPTAYGYEWRYVDAR